MTPVDRLQNWYSEQCNGVWEHTYGVKIDTLDNPGWSVDIDVVGTALIHRTMNRVERTGESDWIVCEVSEGRFRGFGGVANLGDILDVFLSWAE